MFRRIERIAHYVLLELLLWVKKIETVYDPNIEKAIDYHASRIIQIED